MTDIRYDLDSAIRAIPMPANIAARPVSDGGYPVPYYAAWRDDRGKPALEGKGTPDFQTVDPLKARHCVDFDRCWLCGRVLGKWRSLAIEPACLQSGISPLPDCHPDCAEYAARAGFGCSPGVTCLLVHWQRRLLRINQGIGQTPQFRLPEGEPRRLTFWKEGRRAHRHEAIDALDPAHFAWLRTVRLIERWTDDFEERPMNEDRTAAAGLPG